MEEKLDAYIEVLSALKSFNIEPEKMKTLIDKIDVQTFNAIKKRVSYLQNISANLKNSNTSDEKVVSDDSDLSTDDEEEDDKNEEKSEESEKMKRRRMRKPWAEESPSGASKKRKRGTALGDRDRERAKKKRLVDVMVKKAIFLPPDFLFMLIDTSPSESQPTLFARLRGLNKDMSLHFNNKALEALRETSKIVENKDYQGLYKLSRTLSFRLNTFLPKWETNDSPCGLFPLISLFIGEVRVRGELVRRDWFLGLLMVIQSLSVFTMFHTQENSFLRRIGLSRSKFIKDFGLDRGELKKSKFLENYLYKLAEKNKSILENGLKFKKQTFELIDLKGKVILTRTQALYLIYGIPIALNLDFEYLLFGPNDLHNGKTGFYFFYGGFQTNNTNNVQITSENYTRILNKGTDEEKRKLPLVTSILLHSDFELKNIENRKISISKYLDKRVEDFSISIKNSKNLLLNIDCKFKKFYIDACEKCKFEFMERGDIEVLNSKVITILPKKMSKLQIRESSIIYLTNGKCELSISNSKNIFWRSSTTNIDLNSIKGSSELKIIFSIENPVDEDFYRLKWVFGNFQIYWDKFGKENGPRMLRRNYPNENDFWELLELYNLKL